MCVVGAEKGCAGKLVLTLQGCVAEGSSVGSSALECARTPQRTTMKMGTHGSTPHTHTCTRKHAHNALALAPARVAGLPVPAHCLHLPAPCARTHSPDPHLHTQAHTRRTCAFPPQVWQGCLSRLTALTSLRADMHGHVQDGNDAAMGLQAHTRLRELHLAGCYSLPLALSVMRLTGTCTARKAPSSGVARSGRALRAVRRQGLPCAPEGCGTVGAALRCGRGCPALLRAVGRQGLLCAALICGAPAHSPPWPPLPGADMTHLTLCSCVSHPPRACRPPHAVADAQPRPAGLPRAGAAAGELPATADVPGCVVRQVPAQQ